MSASPSASAARDVAARSAPTGSPVAAPKLEDGVRHGVVGFARSDPRVGRQDDAGSGLPKCLEALQDPRHPGGQRRWRRWGARDRTGRGPHDDPGLGQVAQQGGVVVDTVRRHEGAVLDGVHTRRDARPKRGSPVGVRGDGEPHRRGSVREDTQRAPRRTGTPTARPRCDVAAGHHHLDDVDAALGAAAYGGRDVTGHRLRPGQEVAVPPDRRDGRATGEDPGKPEIALAAVPNVHDGVAAVAQAWTVVTPGQGPPRVRQGLVPLGGRVGREPSSAIWGAAPRQVLMSVDETGKECRAETVVDHLSAIGRRLDPSHLEHPATVIDEYLALRPKSLSVKDGTAADDAHPPW